MKAAAPLQKVKTEPALLTTTGNATQNPLQLKVASVQPKQNPLHLKKKNETGLPDSLKVGLEALSGYSMDDVRVHYNSDKPAQLQAHAYAQGTDIHVAPGQEKHLPHEAWHVVQQKQGRVRPTLQLKSKMNLNDDDRLENEADKMGERAGTSAGAQKLQNDSRNSTHPAAPVAAQPVVQRNKHLKRFKNVMTLGLRKAYVNHRRANRAAAQNHVPVQQEDNSLEGLVGAYEKARYYQHVKNATNLPSIEQHGLLNYEDRLDVLGHDVAGLSALGGEYKGDEKKGVFLGPKAFMQENKLTSNIARAYLGSDRTKKHMWFDEEVPDQEMMYDEKFRGGAVITKNSIPANQVTTGNMMDLITGDDPKLASILEAVGSHYQGGTAPSQDQMKALLAEAIRTRRLSNAAFDA